VVAPVDLVRVESIIHPPRELLAAGLDLFRWWAIDANARRRAKKLVGKCEPAKILKKINAIVANYVSDEAGLVAKLDKLALSAAVHEEALKAQPAEVPPIACSEHVVDGKGAGLARVGSRETRCRCMIGPCMCGISMESGYGSWDGSGIRGNMLVLAED